MVSFRVNVGGGIDIEEGDMLGMETEGVVEDEKDEGGWEEGWEVEPTGRCC